MKKHALIIDHISCWGCKTCEVACKQENNVPEGVKLIEVSEEDFSTADDKMDGVFQVNVCRHCDDPPCVSSCPVEAIVHRDDGIVVLDEKTCTGCRLCVDACPYHAISFNTQKVQPLSSQGGQRAHPCLCRQCVPGTLHLFWRP